MNCGDKMGQTPLHLVAHPPTTTKAPRWGEALLDQPVQASLWITRAAPLVFSVLGSVFCGGGSRSYGS